MSRFPELYDEDISQEWDEDDKNLPKNLKTEQSDSDSKNNNVGCDVDCEVEKLKDVAPTNVYNQDTTTTEEIVDLIKFSESANVEDNDNNNEAIKNAEGEIPRKTEVEILTSFSKSGSASNNDHGFFQPNPKNFFDNWPIPFYYLPANKQDTSRGFNLVKFITAGVTNNLKTLGVEEFDCKELVESWLSQRRQRRWTQSLRRQGASSIQKPSSDSQQCIQSPEVAVTAGSTNKSEIAGILSVSKPNSSLLQLTGAGNRELGEFLARMEEVRGHLNNATCTLLQSTILLMLPHLKLLSGHQLDSTSCQTFVEEWIQIISQMAMELQPELPKEAEVMISREFRSLRKNAKRLYKSLKKLNRKIQKIFDHNDVICKKALALLHPKSASSYKGRFAEKNGQDEKILQSETINFSPIPLHQANISTVELFQNHILFSLSNKGALLYKTEIEGEWSTFSELSYGSRREIFLSVVDDLRWTLNSPSTASKHIKELCIKGYPESIRSKISQNLSYLKKAAKQNDLVVLSKVTIVTQVNCLHESTNRLLRALRDAMGISKYFYKCIKLKGRVPTGKRQVQLRTKNVSSKSKGIPTEAAESGREHISLYDNLMTLPFREKAGVKLVVPFPISTDPIEDQFFMSSV
ncbi:hypothetical protein Ocin01_10035 [Orchesella cincta]|uniref:Uncharacterized protein n=1 Tax=Orchesella cincta TaxID=48709 RepID=A0A1D2MVD1_ORCCI|nr:hypothetical protein Ocin01_10035 [Orchesella cincta]